jgi:hypothetical protein
VHELRAVAVVMRVFERSERPHPRAAASRLSYPSGAGRG